MKKSSNRKFVKVSDVFAGIGGKRVQTIWFSKDSILLEDTIIPY